MSERVHARGDVAAAPAPTPPAALKHCWVTDQHGRCPALLLEWRRLESGFEGRVVRPVFDRGWILVDEWMPAEALEPAFPQRPAHGGP